MPRKAKPLPLPLVDPASHPPPGFRAMLIRRVKMKYPELSEPALMESNRYSTVAKSPLHSWTRIGHYTSNPETGLEAFPPSGAWHPKVTQTR